MDMDKMDRIKVDDLQLRPEVFALRLQRRAKLRDAINAGMPDIDKAVSDYKLNEYYDRALEPDRLRPGSRSVQPPGRVARDPRPLRPQHLRPELPAGPAAGRGRHAGRRGHLAQGRQLRQPLVGPPRRPHQADARPVRPDARPGALRPDRPTSTSGACSKETLVVAVGEFGRSPQKGVSTSGNGNGADGRDHWPYCYTAVIAGAGIKRGHVHGKSDKTGSAPLDDPVHPGELLATIYHAFGIDPATIVYNHLNQPRELVKAEAVDPAVRLSWGSGPCPPCRHPWSPSTARLTTHRRPGLDRFARRSCARLPRALPGWRTRASATSDSVVGHALSAGSSRGRPSALDPLHGLLTKTAVQGTGEVEPERDIANGPRCRCRPRAARRAGVRVTRAANRWRWQDPRCAAARRPRKRPRPSTARNRRSGEIYTTGFDHQGELGGSHGEVADQRPRHPPGSQDHLVVAETVAVPRSERVATVRGADWAWHELGACSRCVSCRLLSSSTTRCNRSGAGSGSPIKITDRR